MTGAKGEGVRRFGAVALALALLGAGWGTPRIQAAPAFAAIAFDRQWHAGEMIVPNVWGPLATARDGQQESYIEAAGGQRLVQYFDKGRMELTNGALTNGLLATELITGRLQTGDRSFVDQTPPNIAIAGDPDNPAPTYVGLAVGGAPLLQATRGTPGAPVTAAIDAGGTLTQPGGASADLAMAIGTFDDATRHNVAAAFADYRATVGLATIGYAISEPFRATVRVGGVPRAVMVQVFERRALTYTPSNPPAFRVEMGNIGQHYFTWRYGGSAAPASVAATSPSRLIPAPPARPSPVSPPGSSSGSAGGSTYYITPSGSDANTGQDAAQPWRTFANIGRVPAGGAVLLQAGGIWRGTVTAPHANMTFGVYGAGAKPKVIAPPGQYAFLAGWQPGVSLSGWELTGETRTGGAFGVLGMTSDGYKVANVTVHGVDHYLALFQGFGGSLTGSEFFDCNGAGGDACVQVIGHSDRTPTSPAEVQTISGNSFHDTPYRAFSTLGTMVMVTGNTFTRWAMAGPGDNGNAPAGIYVAGYSPVGTVTVSGNTFNGTGVEDMPLWVDTGPAGVVVTQNVVTNAHYCFWSEKTNGVTFTGNTCRNIALTGVQWGDAPPEGPPSVGGMIGENIFAGPPPTDGGWIRIFPKSSATIRSNTEVP